MTLFLLSKFMLHGQNQNNACDILRMREKSVRDALECNQEHTTSSAFYLEHFNNSQLRSSVRMSVLKHCNMCFEMLNENNKYYSYANKADFTVTVWFYIRELFKNDVTDFFKQHTLHQWHSTLSFTNSSEWLNSLHQILYEIQDNEWSAVKIAILQDANDSELTEYTFYYRNVMKTVEFLIRHELFKNNLIYASVQAYSLKDKAKHMYNELHTENWWWKTQKQLSHDITIISLLLETDKTLLIMLHDDQSVWLIYLIIENLDTAIQHSQLKSNTVLLSFISISEKKKENFKLQSAIWHETMKQVLLCMFSVSLHS